VILNLTVICPPSTTDFEGNTYNVTKLAGLCWTDNLKSTLYTCSEEPIPFAKPYTCADCPDDLEDIFGLLYDWYSTLGIDEDGNPTQPADCICPDGFRLPTLAEWALLEGYPASKLMSTQYWLNPPGPGTDDYGFNALPAGWYNGVLERFEELYGFAGWWASDDIPGTTTAHYFWISYYCEKKQKEGRNKLDGLSVRCVLDR
jgi:uncharacterized protein (TIGR02145 family)